MIVLTYPGAGAVDLQHLLDRSGALCCTTGTGMLPLCEMAASTWRRVDDRDGPLTALALASVRALADGMITTLQARLGGWRWCEIAFSPPAGAGAFLQAYPATRVLCLHRDAAAVVRAGVLANPWGVAGTPYAAFASTYPANSAAIIAAYWASRTEQLLQFGTAHPGICLRVRHEDLADEPGQTAAVVGQFLDLDIGQPAAPSREPDKISSAQLPAGQLPEPLLALVNGLQDRLGYPAVA